MGAVSSVQIAAVQTAFGVAYGQDFPVALATGIVRCDTQDWAPDAGNEVKDFVAFVLGSTLVGANAATTQPNAEKLLIRTWQTLATKDGWTGKPVAAGSPGENNILVILTAVIIAAEAAVIAYCVYRASQIVTNLLAVVAADRELMRAHKDAMQTIDAHAKKESVAGKALPYDVAELAILQALQQAQDDAAGTSREAMNASEGSGATQAGGGFLVGLAVAAALAWAVWGPKRAR